MASATRDPYSFRPSDAASVSGASSSTSSGDRKVKLRCSYGGKILHRLSDGALRYVGGVSRIVAVSRDSTLPEIMRKMAEAYGGPVVLRYQLPDEDLDALITVSTAEDLENMMEECDKLAVDNPNAKLRVFLCSPAETAGAGTDPLAAYSDFQDGSTRYLEAVNGLDSVIRRRDSATSLSSTQNSDGLTAAEAVAKEGMSPPHVSPTAKSSQDASKFDFGAQDMPNLLPITVSSDQTEFSTVSQSEVPYVVPSQSEILNSIQAELPSVTPFVPQPYLDQHIPMMNPQPFQVIGLPPQINVIPVLPHTYMAPAQSNTPRPQVVNGMTKLDPKIESNGGKIAKIPFDPRLQPLSQLPPLPPPHLLAPTVERRQVLLSSQGLTVGSPDCSSCQTALPHVRSEPVINAQDKGLKHAFSETNSILYSGNSEDLPRKAPQTTEVLLPVDHGIETQPVNLVEAIPPRTFGCSVINQEIPQIRGKAIVNSTNLESVRVFVPPISTCLPSTLQATNISNPEKIPNADILQQRQELPLNPDHSNILFKPASLAMAPKPHGHGTFIVPQQSHVEDSLQYQVQLPQQTGHHKYPINPDFISKPFVSDASLVGESGFLEDGQAIHGTLPAFSYGCVTPINGIMGTLCMNPPGNPGFTDQPRPAVFADISQNLKPEPPLIMVNSHNTGPLDRGNELSIRNPLITYLVGPEGNDGFLTHQVPSMSNDAYQQNAQLSNASHTPDIGRNYGPYPYHTEARGGPREMVNYVGHTYTNCSINGNLIVGMNNDVLNVQLQQALSFEPLVSNKHTQKKFDNSLMPPRPSNVSCKQSVVTEDFHNCDHPLSIGSEITHPSDGVSNHNAHSDVAHPAKDMEDAYIKQDMQTIEGSMPTSVHQLSEVPIPVLNSHAIKDIVPSSDDECGNIGKKTEIDEQTETNAKPSEKKRNGFLNTDDIEHLQVIKYNDLEELQELGSGTFGTVYYGKWRGTDVAIKRINDSFFSGKLSEQERARADFWNEACILASLHHPNVVAFYGIVLDGPGESIATVTEFMVNGSLRRALQKNEKMFDSRRRLFITMDVAFGMEYLHSKNIIHFDLKSDNLLVNLRDLQRPICKVGDLGLSKVKYDTLMSGGMRGTLPWMAPELLGGKDNKCSEKVDVFSFGIVMWEIITGEEPYKDMHYGAIIGGIMTDTLRPSVPESCDPDWRSLMEQCWATEPSQRPSFTEIASRLRAMEASLPQKG